MNRTRRSVWVLLETHAQCVHESELRSLRCPRPALLAQVDLAAAAAAETIQIDESAAATGAAAAAAVSAFPSILHSVAVAEFDELKGNTLSQVYPEDATPRIASHTPAQIAELCLPDGAHRVPRDVSYMLLRGEDGEALYAVSSFRNVADTMQKRGARQFALVIVATVPRFDLFEMILSQACVRSFDPSLTRH